METWDQHTAERKMKVKSESVNHSVMSDFLQSHGQTPWSLKFSSKNTGVGSHSLPKESSGPRDQTQVSYIAGRFLTVWATREAQWGIEWGLFEENL